MPNLINLPSHDEDGQLQVVVEAPRGSRAKFKYDPAEQTFKFARPLCLGTAYPYDWGFVPGTRAEDGDPMDAMVYHDMPTYPGVIIPSKAIGVVRLIQKEKGEKWERNDRLIVVPSGWEGPKAAKALIQKAVKAYDRGKK
jgi:inorganic pyrophosphatase